MIYPQDIMDALAEQIRGKFPGEPVYLNREPSGFQRPSTLVALGKCAGQADMGFGVVELRPVVAITAFTEVDEYHHSHLQELNRRQMVLTGLLLPGYVQVQDRAPKVVKLEMESGWDFATVAATFSVTLDREDFISLEQAPVAQTVGMAFQVQDERR